MYPEDNNYQQNNYQQPAYQQPAYEPVPDPVYSAPVTPAKPKKKMNIGCLLAILIPIGLAIIGTILTVVLIIIGVASSSGSSGGSSSFVSAESKLRTAYNSYCTSTYAELGYDGSYLSIDTNPNDSDDYFSNTAWSQVQQVNDYLGLPASFEEKLLETRALDGRQTYTYGDFTMSWTYHPDRGLEIMYEAD